MCKVRLTITFLVTMFVIGTTKSQNLVYHDIVKDVNGYLMPWYNNNYGSSYDHCLKLAWIFWQNVDTCCGGQKLYMIDHTNSGNQPQGNKIGGDQFAMALSSWALYYAYTGDTNLIKDMIYIANTYLSNSLTNSFDTWANLPYSCNYSNHYVAHYDGDFLIGAGWVQPDKAGSFGAELVTLYKITGNTSYLQAAVDIANTLALRVQPGSATVSPYPFRANASDGSLPQFSAAYHYTGNVIPTIRLFESLIALNQGNTLQYNTAIETIKNWLKLYPVQNSQWGSFFEDIPVPSNTEINAVTAAQYIIEKGNDWGNNWQHDARNILDSALAIFGSHNWDSVGATAIYEQTADMKEASSHTARYASVELIYAEQTGDTSRIAQAIRQLSWATYLVDFDGKVRFSPASGSIWYTDGYGDFIRHYMRAMAAYPAIAPDSSNHLLRTTSVVTYINYQPLDIYYNTFDNNATETLRLTSKPLQVLSNGNPLTELQQLTADGYTWQPMTTGGLLKIKHSNANAVHITWSPTGISDNRLNSVVSISPNPACSIVTVSSTQPLTAVALYNLNGTKLWQTEPAGNNRITIPVQHLPGGVYLLETYSNQQRHISKIIVAN